MRTRRFLLLVSLGMIGLSTQFPATSPLPPRVSSSPRLAEKLEPARPIAAMMDGGGQQPVKVVDASGNDVPVSQTTEAAHDGPLGTLTAVKGLLDFCRARASVPSGVSADDDAVLGWCNLVGARATFPVANASGGADPCYVPTTASTNAFTCKAGPGTVYDLSAVNTTGTIYYLRMYNLAATPACSLSTGFVESIPIPASTTAAGIVRTYPVGRNYSTGIAGCVTLNAANNDNNPAAVGVFISFGYK